MAELTLTEIQTNGARWKRERDALRSVLEFYANPDHWDGRELVCTYGDGPQEPNEPAEAARAALQSERS